MIEMTAEGLLRFENSSNKKTLKQNKIKMTNHIGIGCAFPSKLRFENQNLTKTKKQAICFSLLSIYS
ncbi:hypothetical protein DZC72_15890 [Maribacter algicola]|uniref:Uncharacterized protein n=1 Tax=Maribacter algicola TaxID=2498892 RepID=A0A426RFF3_9FLAO|nr:hypothetical protein DZC72_15890 [Maribacter algicola]